MNRREHMQLAEKYLDQIEQMPLGDPRAEQLMELAKMHMKMAELKRSAIRDQLASMDDEQ